MKKIIHLVISLVAMYSWGYSQKTTDITPIISSGTTETRNLVISWCNNSAYLENDITIYTVGNDIESKSSLKGENAKGGTTDQLVDVLLYPQPANGFLNVLIKNAEYKDLSLKVLSILGKVEFSQQIETNPVNMNISELASGFYIVKILNQHGKQIFISKFNVQ